MKRSRLVGTLLVLAVSPALLLTGCAKSASSTPASTTATPGPSGPPAKIAADGAKLATIAVPPAAMASLIKSPTDRAGETYTADFSVYGYGQPRDGHHTLVVQFVTLIPTADTPDRLGLAGKNASLEIGPGVKITKAGTYSGTVKLVKSGGGQSYAMVLTAISGQ